MSRCEGACELPIDGGPDAKCPRCKTPVPDKLVRVGTGYATVDKVVMAKFAAATAAKIATTPEEKAALPRVSNMFAGNEATRVHDEREQRDQGEE